MRIISGRLRGRKLKGPAGLELRPTADRLKETLFNILGPSLEDKVWLDVFAGTGAIGIEAISRGAREVIFIEQSSAGCRLIRKNLDLCGVTRGYHLIQQDAFTALRQLARRGFTSDVIFMDPPYRWQPFADLLDTVFSLRLAHDETRVVIEHQRRAVLPADGQGYASARVVTQGDHCLTFYCSLAERALRSAAEQSGTE